MVRHINNAVGMFNAGENLRAYQTDGGSLTKDERERRNSTIIPMAVVVFFGIEVAFKALIEDSGQPRAKGHDLRNLYKKLRPDIRQHIETRAQTFGLSPDVVYKLIQYHRRGFEEWRYIQEQSAPMLIEPDKIFVLLKSIIETHSELYGTSSRTAVPLRTKSDSPPQSVQDVAKDYARDVLGNDKA